MKLKSLKLKNFKGFESVNLDFNGKSTVIFGINGMGKSSILSAINYLSWGWISRLNSSQGTAYKSLSADLVHTGCSTMELCAEMNIGAESFELKKAYTKAKVGKHTSVENYKALYDTFVKKMLEVYEENGKNVPVFIHYGTNRAVTGISLKIKKKVEMIKWDALSRTIENELDYKAFFEWFRNQEDYEAEMIRTLQDLSYRDKSLECVRTSIEAMLEGFSDLKVKRNPLRMTVSKDGHEYDINQLSDGEKCTLALFGDISRRLALANPYMDNPAEGGGIILIDELELHLHPTWQRKILRILSKSFPNIQFIITTHSPQILGEADDNYNVFCITKDDEDVAISLLPRMDAYDSNLILEDFMETSSKNEAYVENLNNIKKLIRDKKFDDVITKIDELKAKYTENLADIVELEGYLLRSKICDGKN